MTVEIQIGKSHYKIACKTEEKEKLLELVKRLNKRLDELSFSLKFSDEKMLLVMAALTMEEELISATEEKFTSQEVCNSMSDNIENIANYIGNLTKKIQKL